MTDYLEMRNKALFDIKSSLSEDIFISNPYLIYHPSVNPLGTSNHFTLFNDESAICCTEEEALILYQIAKKLQPNLFIEVGSYAGWSTAHILEGLTPPFYTSFFAVDNFSECNKPDLVKEVLTNVVKQYKNAFVFEVDSTEFLNKLVTKADVIFIDGFHRDGKPLLDVKAATKALKPDGYIILHDTWMPEVNKACDWLVENGYQCYTFSTDNQLEIYTKGDLSWIKEIVV